MDGVSRVSRVDRNEMTAKKPVAGRCSGPFGPAGCRGRGDWKLVVGHLPGESVGLYNLGGDLGERTNLAARIRNA
ncbi:MAG: hypothetical protein Ct9H300mP1_01680 [Planctomycetaceae bacterium]|nr:MAG: hypothetical protein Ct9H300mP1_01680 [Planctomycetaceae bacterium]